MEDDKNPNSLDAQIKDISNKSGTPVEDIKKQIEEKQDELSGLVSEEGAMHIVARELGLNLLKEKKRNFKIANLVSGLRSVDITGKIIAISDVRQFERDGKPGQVLNITLGDETGSCRMSLWNDEIKIIEKLGLKEGICLKLTNGYVKMDNMDNPELRLGRGGIEVAKQADIKVMDTHAQGGSFGSSAPPAAKRQRISELREGSFAEIRAALVQLFRRNPFYNICPNCEGRLTQKEEAGSAAWYCEEHGKVEPKPQLVLSGVVDDGTDNIRVVFFREVAEKVFGKGTEELAGIGKEANDSFAVYEHFNGLGREFIIRGRVKRNSFTDSIELVANDVADVDVKKEAESLLRDMAGSKA